MKMFIQTFYSWLVKETHFHQKISCLHLLGCWRTAFQFISSACLPSVTEHNPRMKEKKQEPDITGEQEETKYSGRGREQRDTDEK